MRQGVLAYFLLMSSVFSGCSSNESSTANGYVEGLLTYVASSSSGYLETLAVARGSQVTEGSLLFTLNPQPENHAYQAALDDLEQAKANKEDIIAKLQFAEQTLKRDKVLYNKRVLQKSALDQAQADRDSLFAQNQEADATISEKTAQLATNAWTLSQKRMRSTKKAVVFDVYYRLGEYVSSDQAVLSLLAPEDIKIIFYVTEPVVAKLQVGDTIQAACDGCQWVNSKISFISPVAEYTPPLIFSNDTNSTLVYRIEAVFDHRKATDLHPGQPVTVKYAFNG